MGVPGWLDLLVFPSSWPSLREALRALLVAHGFWVMLGGYEPKNYMPNWLRIRSEGKYCKAGLIGNMAQYSCD
jgi:hypothetical protein